MRMFVAAVPPASVVESLDAFLDPRRDAAEFRWTLPDQWHLTLAFLESVPDRSLDELVERLAHAASRRTPIQAVVSGGIAFPHVGKAKVLAAGVASTVPTTRDEGDELDRLAAGCRAAAVKSGVEVDGQKFVPHLTLARFGVRPIEASNWVRLLDSYQSPAWPIDEVALIASHLRDGPGRRPRYEVVETFPLGG